MGTSRDRDARSASRVAVQTSACIGAHNMRYFFLFLLHGSLGTAMALIVTSPFHMALWRNYQAIVAGAPGDSMFQE